MEFGSQTIGLCTVVGSMPVVEQVGENHVKKRR